MSFLGEYQSIKNRAEPYGPNEFRNRLRSLQSLCSRNSNEGLLLIGGVDGGFSKGVLFLLKFLVRGESGIDVFNETLEDEPLEDVVILIKFNSIAIFCTPFTKKKLITLSSLCSSCHIFCQNEDIFEKNADDDQLFKIKSFLSMVKGCTEVLIPIASEGKIQKMKSIDIRNTIEKWPLIQAFGMDEMKTGGFFTMKHTVRNCFEACKTAARQLDKVYLRTIVPDSLKKLSLHWSSLIKNVSIIKFNPLNSNPKIDEDANYQIDECILGCSKNSFKLEMDNVFEPLNTYYMYGSLSLSDTVSKWRQESETCNIDVKASDCYKLTPSIKAKHIGCNSTSNFISLSIEGVDPICGIRAARSYFVFPLSESLPSSDENTNLDFERLLRVYNCCIELVKIIVNSFVTKDSPMLIDNHRVFQYMKASNTFPLPPGEYDYSKNMKMDLCTVDATGCCFQTLDSKNNTDIFDNETKTLRNLKYLRLEFNNIPSVLSRSNNNNNNNNNDNSLGSIAFGETFCINYVSLAKEMSSALILTSSPIIPNFLCWVKNNSKLRVNMIKVKQNNVNEEKMKDDSEELFGSIIKNTSFSSSFNTTFDGDNNDHFSMLNNSNYYNNDYKKTKPSVVSMLTPIHFFDWFQAGIHFYEKGVKLFSPTYGSNESSDKSDHKSLSFEIDSFRLIPNMINIPFEKDVIKEVLLLDYSIENRKDMSDIFKVNFDQNSDSFLNLRCRYQNFFIFGLKIDVKALPENRFIQMLFKSVMSSSILDLYFVFPSGTESGNAFINKVMDLWMKHFTELSITVYNLSSRSGNYNDIKSRENNVNVNDKSQSALLKSLIKNTIDANLDVAVMSMLFNEKMWHTENSIIPFLYSPFGNVMSGATSTNITNSEDRNDVCVHFHSIYDIQQWTKFRSFIEDVDFNDAFDWHIPQSVLNDYSDIMKMNENNSSTKPNLVYFDRSRGLFQYRKFERFKLLGEVANDKGNDNDNNNNNINNSNSSDHKKNKEIIEEKNSKLNITEKSNSKHSLVLSKGNESTMDEPELDMDNSTAYITNTNINIKTNKEVNQRKHMSKNVIVPLYALLGVPGSHKSVIIDTILKNSPSNIHWEIIEGSDYIENENIMIDENILKQKIVVAMNLHYDVFQNDIKEVKINSSSNSEKKEEPKKLCIIIIFSCYSSAMKVSRIFEGLNVSLNSNSYFNRQNLSMSNYQRHHFVFQSLSSVVQIHSFFTDDSFATTSPFLLDQCKHGFVSAVFLLDTRRKIMKDSMLRTIKFQNKKENVEENDEEEYNKMIFRKVREYIRLVNSDAKVICNNTIYSNINNNNYDATGRKSENDKEKMNVEVNGENKFIYFDSNDFEMFYVSSELLEHSQQQLFREDIEVDMNSNISSNDYLPNSNGDYGFHSFNSLYMQRIRRKLYPRWNCDTNDIDLERYYHHPQQQNNNLSKYITVERFNVNIPLDKKKTLHLLSCLFENNENEDEEPLHKEMNSLINELKGKSKLLNLKGSLELCDMHTTTEFLNSYDPFHVNYDDEGKVMESKSSRTDKQYHNTSNDCVYELRFVKHVICIRKRSVLWKQKMLSKSDKLDTEKINEDVYHNMGLDFEGNQKYIEFFGEKIDRIIVRKLLLLCLRDPKPLLSMDMDTLPIEFLNKIRAKHLLVPDLPPSWFFDGSSYVNMSGERSFYRPDMNVFIEREVLEANKRIEAWNSNLKKERSIALQSMV